MLAVGVDDQDELAARVADAGLHRRAVALVVRMANDAGAGRTRAAPPSSSVEPSSTTMISRQEAAARSCDDDDRPIASASFMAGITIETLDGSAKKLLDDAVPRDRPGDVLACVAEAVGKCPVSRERIDGRRQRWRAQARTRTR